MISGLMVNAQTRAHTHTHKLTNTHNQTRHKAHPEACEMWIRFHLLTVCFTKTARYPGGREWGRPRVSALSLSLSFFYHLSIPCAHLCSVSDSACSCMCDAVCMRLQESTLCGQLLCVLPPLYLSFPALAFYVCPMSMWELRLCLSSLARCTGCRGCLRRVRRRVCRIRPLSKIYPLQGALPAYEYPYNPLHLSFLWSTSYP